MSFPRYPEYKDSGVEWLGEVPAHWDYVRLRRVVSMNPSKSEIADLDKDTEVTFLPMESVSENGELDLSRTRPVCEVETGYTYFRNGDVTYAKITPCFENGKGALMRGLEHGVGFGTTELTVVRARPDHSTAEFIDWLFRSPEFRKNGEASMYGAGGQKRVPDEFVREFKIGIPPVKEQEYIATFLDRETTKIDSLIAEQEKLIALLKEKRQAVISHAVTKGLDPSVKMKDSGIEWLGEVPGHWDVLRAKNIFEIKKRIAGTEGYDVLSITQKGIKIKDTESNDGQLSMDYSKYQFVEAGDYAMNHMDLLTGYVDLSKYHGVTSPDYRVFSLRDDKKFCGRYYLRLLQNGYTNKLFYPFGQGSSQLGRWRLPTEEFNNFLYPVPPIHEQKAIVVKLDQIEDEFSNLSDQAEKGIALLKERRSALISAAVTGKINVGDF